MGRCATDVQRVRSRNTSELDHRQKRRRPGLREQEGRGVRVYEAHATTTYHTTGTSPTESPWLTPRQAAVHANVTVRVLYREAQLGRLRCARVSGRRCLRFLKAWIDEPVPHALHRRARAGPR